MAQSVKTLMRYIENAVQAKKLIFVALIGLFFVGECLSNKNICLWAAVLVFIFNVVEAGIRKKQNSVFYIIFHGMIFLFILDRPLISFFNGDDWWWDFSTKTAYTTVFILLVSFIFLNVGYYAQYEKSFRKNKHLSKVNDIIENPLNFKLRKIWMVATCVTLVASLVKEIINMFYFFGDYTAMYTGVQVEVPLIVNILAGISFYCMSFYLAFMPSKKNTIIVLSLYIISGVPGILVGGRNALMIKVLYCFIYFVLRELLQKRQKWISKKQIVAVIVAIPLLMVALGVVNYTRDGEEVPTFSPVSICVDFLYKQGTSFDTLLQTVHHRNPLRNDYYTNYTFGGLIDFINYNEISNLLFGTADLGDGNNILNGTISNNLAHRISYLVLGKSYLEGHGRGTTYFSEIYLDFGYLGVAFFNLLVGIFLSKIMEILQSGYIQRLILLNCLLYFFMIPRLAFFSIVSFIINYYFWITAVLFVMICFVLKKARGKKDV